MTEPAAYPFSDFLKRYGIGRTKAYEEINSGRLKARKVGKRTLVTEADAQAWLDSLPAFRPGKAA